MTSFNASFLALLTFAVAWQSSNAFVAPRVGGAPSTSILHSTAENAQDFVECVPVFSSVTDPEAIRLREELLKLSEETSKGFKSTTSQKKRASEIVAELAKFNPTTDPAAPYYDNASSTEDASCTVSLTGKWNLIYTDAPDITSLDTSWNPLATAKLGRIGQECTPPYIKNVIEWKKPDWTNPLPFAGNKDSRILQKVCTQASADPSKPMLVNLKVAGIELVAPPTMNANGDDKNSLQQNIEQEGLPVGLLRNNPLELRGPLTAPFGQFEILYLDEEMRIIRTNQNYLAVNVRAQEEWF